MKPALLFTGTFIFNKFQTPMTLTVDRTIVSKNVNDLLRAQLCAASSCSFISTKDRAVMQPTEQLPSVMMPRKRDVVSNKRLQFRDGATRPQMEAGTEPEDLQRPFLPLGFSSLWIRVDRLENTSLCFKEVSDSQTHHPC